MNNKIYEKIDEIFKDKNAEDFVKLKKEITFDCKKLYNQMIQSGFSEYIAVAENLDNLKKIEQIVQKENNIITIREQLSEEKKLKDNIKNTTSQEKLGENYDKDYIENIKKLVEGAALETVNLDNLDIKEQSDEIVYKTEKSNQDTTNKTVNNNDDENKSTNKKYIFDSKNYFIRLGTFVGVIGVTALIVVLLHIFKVF